MVFLEPVFWLAINIYHEARGESTAGQVAVAHVVLNRATAKGMSVKDVVLQRKQFSWANGGARPSMSDYEALLQCTEAAMLALEERLDGKTFKGADHYHAISMSPYPSWAKNMTVVATVGGHVFYRDA